MEILIFVHEENSRLAYAFDLIFKQILKVSYKLTTDKEFYLSSTTTKFVYRKSPLDKGLFFYSADLLFEKEIKSQNVQSTMYEGLRTLFPNENYGCIPFDPFAASFYLVSRYEEYIIKQRDGHNRFDHNNSIAKRNNFLQVPVVNYYAEIVRNQILKNYPNAVFPELKYSYLPTIDIDNAFAYSNKSAYRVLPNVVAGFLRLKFRDSYRKLLIYLGKREDPYDTFDKQIELHDKYHLKPIYFFLLGNLSKFDRNVSHTNANLQAIIKKIAGKYRMGMHPSYMSNRWEELFKLEKSRMEEISGLEIQCSRQHFLKFKLPDTYTKLLANGIKEDFTMGYSKEIGFRASICTPFYFYNLKEEKMTELLVHPFCIMDSTLKFHMKLRSSEAIYTIKPLIDHVKKVNGQLITVFHNESFGTHKVWRNWSEVYDSLLKIAIPRK